MADINRQNAAPRGLTDNEREMALRLLRCIINPGSRSNRLSRLRLCALRLHLRYEIFRLGHDADSLYLYRRSMEENLPLPPLTLRVWAQLVRELR